MASGNWKLGSWEWKREGERATRPSPGIAKADSRSFQLDPALGSPRSEPRPRSLPLMPCIVHHLTAECRSLLRSRDPVHRRRKALLHMATASRAIPIGIGPLRASGSAGPRIDIVCSTPGAACYLVVKVWNQESPASSPPLVPPPLGPHCPQSPTRFFPSRIVRAPSTFPLIGSRSPP